MPFGGWEWEFNINLISTAHLLSLRQAGQRQGSGIVSPFTFFMSAPTTSCSNLAGGAPSLFLDRQKDRTKN